MENQLNSSMVNFPGFSSLSIFRETQKDLTRKNIQLEQIKDCIILMSMFNDNERKTNEENCNPNIIAVKNYARKLSQVHWTFFVPESKEK